MIFNNELKQQIKRILIDSTEKLTDYDVYELLYRMGYHNINYSKIHGILPQIVGNGIKRKKIKYCYPHRINNGVCEYFQVEVRERWGYFYGNNSNL